MKGTKVKYSKSRKVRKEKKEKRIEKKGCRMPIVKVM